MFDLTDRVVLVTGASSGLGRHFATVLARCGARLVLGARRTSLLEETRSEVEAAGSEAMPLTMDVADEASVMAAFDAAEARFGEVHSVIANAGVTIGGSALGIAVEDFDRIFAVNTRGAFLTAREAARRMISKGAPERRHGRIVLISSVTADYVQPNAPIYGASKAALNQLGRSMARDWSTKGVNVNMLSPGYMKTELTGEWLESERAKALLSGFPRRRIMDVDALDPMMTYLCSAASEQVTGSVFTIDDGQTL